MTARAWVGLFGVGLLLGCLILAAFGGYAWAVATLTVIAVCCVGVVTGEFLKANNARQTSPVDGDREQGQWCTETAQGQQR